MTWPEYKAMLDAHPSMVERRLQCELDGHFQDLTSPGHCLVCGEDINEQESHDG
jgi:hypothetical protein